VFLARANTTLQLEALPEMRGRVMALWAVAFIGSTPIGGPIIGWIGQHAGPRWGLAVGGGAAAAAAGLGFLALVRARRREAAPLMDTPGVTSARAPNVPQRAAVA
jgi:MFS family permease